MDLVPWIVLPTAISVKLDVLILLIQKAYVVVHVVATRLSRLRHDLY